MKTCTKCKKYKDTNEFYKRTNGIISSDCKSCVKQREKQKRDNMTEEQKLKEKLRLKKYSLDNLESLKIKRKAYWDRNKDKSKNTKLFNSYGISLEKYNEMHRQQLGLCAICHKPEEGTIKGIVKRLSVDHCHKSKKIRGLLCAKCNSAIGLFQDDKDLITSALLYINKNL